MRTWLRPNASMMASRFAEIGKSGSCLKTSSRALRARIAPFRQLFGNLVGGLAGMFEVKARARRPLAELVGAHQCRQRLRHSVQMTALGVGGAVLGIGGTVLGIGGTVLGIGGAVLGVGGTALGRLDVFPNDALFGL